MLFADIIIDISHTEVDRLYTYRIPDEYADSVCLGMGVLVDFGKSKGRIGYIMGFKNETDYDIAKIKPIIKPLNDYSLLSESLIKLAWWMKDKYYTTLFSCLHLVLPKGDIEPKKEKHYYVSDNISAEECIISLSSKKNLVKSLMLFKVIKENEGIGYNTLAQNEIFSKSSLNTLITKGFIECRYKEKVVTIIKDITYNSLIAERTEEQANAVSGIINEIEEKNLKPSLLFGVTGSGKTEVYMDLIDYILQKGKDAIVLVPEISLTPQMVKRFTDRFHDKVFFTHSKQSKTERLNGFRKARNGEISIMIGPRSAVFTPFNNLGIIVIDEEHDTSYSSDQTPKYDAREVAAKRCELEGAKLVLGSATPSLKSFYKGRQGEYNVNKLSKRINDKGLPDVSIVDMTKELKEGNRSTFSSLLKERIRETLFLDRQVMLFLNRRGYSTFVSCRYCGHVMKCEHCNVSYTYHKNNDKLICHYCGDKKDNPNECPVCSTKFIKFMGIGTQKIEEEIKELFPDAKVLRMDFDTTSKRYSHENILKAFRNKEADILLGTQMIAKGHDFKDVSLVGIMLADLSLHVSDYRASEITYQLITQVAGRAGRKDLKGEVVLQTYSPDHYTIKLAKEQNYEAFYDMEMVNRTKLNYPPCSNIFSVVLTGHNEKDVAFSAYELSDVMKYYAKNKAFRVFNPAPCAVSKIKNEYRWNIIAIHNEEENLKNFVIYSINKWRERTKHKQIMLSIHLNPNHIM